MRAGKKRVEPGQRDKAIAYKKVFGSEDGKIVLIDLMNKFHILNSHKGDPRLEGQREVVLWIMSQAHLDLAALDKMLAGEA